MESVTISCLLSMMARIQLFYSYKMGLTGNLFSFN